MGRWGEADGILRDGRFRHPESEVLEEAHLGLGVAWERFRAIDSLAQSWREGLAPLDGVALEVDEAVIRHGFINELPELVVLGARRLWRTYVDVHRPSLQLPEPWGVALLIAILELDGESPSIAAMARPTRSPASTTRAALTRFRRFLGELDSKVAHRAFGATTNPQLQTPAAEPSATETGTVVPFPSA
jgi:hypothetical protein